MFFNHTVTSDTPLSTDDSLTGSGEAATPSARPWDDSDPFISARVRDLLRTLFECYVGQLIMFIGIPGNIISCLVFWKQGLSDKINLLLFWLAVSDLLTLTSSLIGTCYCYLSDSISISNFKTILLAKIHFVYFWSFIVSGSLIVVMSVDRCLSVTMPLKAKRLLTYRSMLVAIFFAYLVPLACFMPAFLGMSVEWREDPLTNRSIAYLSAKKWSYIGGRLPAIIINYLFLVSTPTYFVIVTASCIITIVHLRQASRTRLQMTGKVRNDMGDNKITKMLLLLFVIYAVLLILHICSAFVYNLVPEYSGFRKYHNSFTVMYHVVIFTATCVNSTANQFVYLVLSSRYRKTLSTLCCCWKLNSQRQD